MSVSGLLRLSPCTGERIEVRGPKAHASCQSEPSPSPCPLRRARRPICAQRVLILAGRANGQSIKAPVSISRHELLQRFSHFFLTDNQIDEQQIQRDQFEPKVINRLADE